MQPPDLYELAQQAFDRFRAEFTRYGLVTDPGLRLQRGRGLLCCYHFEDRQIYLSLPDLRASTGKLQMLLFRELLCADSNEDLLRFLALFIPFIVAHEMAHHLRHRAGLFGRDYWLEEQIANQLAAALNRHRIAPPDRAFAVRFLQRAVKALGERLGLGDKALDSYYDIVHAMQASARITSADMDGFRLAQGVAGEPHSATSALRDSGALADSVNQRLARRGSVISAFNAEYASDPARYAYYQMGWVCLAMQGTEASYVDELARLHLGRTVAYLPVAPAQPATKAGIRALHGASRIAMPRSPVLGRYFYKRYRCDLLAGLEQEADGADVLAMWDDRHHDPLTFLAGMLPPAWRALFPQALAAAAPDAAVRPEDLPTAADRALWACLEQPAHGEAAATLQLLERFDGLELFRPLPPEVVVALGRKSYTVLFEAGETLVWQGETNQDIFILLEGLLETHVAGQAQRRTMAPGEIFGEVAWLTQGSRSATVRALQASTCLVIKGHDLHILAYRSPAILHSVAATLARRLRSS